MSGCATTSGPQPVASTAAQNKITSWDSRVQTLSEIENWNLKALIAIRNQSDAGTATLQWQQQLQKYHILIFGPIGTGSYELTGQPGKVELASSNGHRFYAKNPESLLQQQTGWKLPISHLHFWIRGLPAPGISAEKNLDHSNHLIGLKQDGWDIQFLRYVSVNGIDLPNKIFMNNSQVNVKIIINQWQF